MSKANPLIVNAHASYRHKDHRSRFLTFAVFLAIILASINFAVAGNKGKFPVDFDSLAPTPPMGWNSWDCLGLDANEAQVKAVADYMAAHLKKYGWQYVVIDAGWFHPKELTTAKSHTIDPPQNLDEFGRLIPDAGKYPSSANGVGFKVLADYVHRKGLKFGIHIMRGIPWNAVANKTPIKGTSYFASDVANLKDVCNWSPIMKGVDMSKPGAQAYYDSVFELYAEWGVDFVKVDDMPLPAHEAEIEGVHQAILNSKAPIVFSLSSNVTPLNKKNYLAQAAHMWRISNDFWDDWKWLKLQFEICRQWDFPRTPGRWPDADMLPLGKLRKTGGDAWIASQLGSTMDKVTDEYSRFTDPEKYSLMTLWCIFKSPLMLGGYLPENDAITDKLITNEEVIAVNQQSANNHEVRNRNGIVIWMADQPGTQAKYVAIFNLNDGRSETVNVSWREIGLAGRLIVRDLWAKKNLGRFDGEFAAKVEPHGCVLMKVSE
jgi:hypothetical protein